MTERKLFILGGANGSGKTTISNELLKDYELVFLNADEIAMGIYPDRMEKARIKAGKLLIKQLDDLIGAGRSFALESTLAGKYLLKKISECRKYGYRIILIYIFLDNHEVALNRIRTRVRNGGHDIPERDVIRRFHRSKKNFWEYYKDIVDEWILYYNGEDQLVHVATGWPDNIEIVEESLLRDFMRGI